MAAETYDIRNNSRVSKWLGLLNNVRIEDSGKLQNFIKKQANLYKQLVETHKPFNVNDSIERLNPQQFHPLAQGMHNPWVLQQEDLQLVELILNDVKRTFQDNLIFLNPDVLQSMQRILYILSKNSHDLSYKQGFNDICGVCVYVTLQHRSNTDLSLNILEESICYTLLNGMLSTGVDDFYRTAQSNDKIIVVDVCDYIFHSLLKKIDSELYNKLIKIEIEPHVFLMRWIRVVFAREHTLENTIKIWDAFIEDYSRSKSLRFIHYFAVAMLIHIKSKLMDSDVNKCIQLLFNYPSIDCDEEIDQIIANTLEYIKETSDSTCDMPP